MPSEPPSRPPGTDPAALPPAAHRRIVSSRDPQPYPPSLVSDKGATLLRLTRLGYPVPEFVILTSQASAEWGEQGAMHLQAALAELESLTGRALADPEDPLILAVRAAMPRYIPGFMPTFLNVAVAGGALAGLERRHGSSVARRTLLATLRNLAATVCPQLQGDPLLGRGRPEPGDREAAIARLTAAIAAVDRRLLEDPVHQVAHFVGQVHRFCDDHAEVLLTLARGAASPPAVILQRMVCTIRDDRSYAGVICSRHPQTGVGVQLRVGRDLFGEEIMTGTATPEERTFTDPAEIRGEFPAVGDFVPQIEALERELEAPVTIEFATEGGSTRGVEVLQVNREELTGRGAIISVVDLHQSGVISRARVAELIAPYHVKQIESDAIDRASLDTLEFFGHGVSILPRRAISARIYFSPDAALRAKRRGELVCFCRRTFEPSDTAVMREMDAILSVTAAAIHVVTICQSFGVPALLNLERGGATLTADLSLVNAAGQAIAEGDWITISSQRQALYRGRAAFKPARLMRFMKGEAVELAPDEREAFAAMAYAYRYYRQLVRGLNLEQISKLNELIRIVNIELRGDAEEGHKLVCGWFDSHEALYVEEVLASDMGDHLNQSTVFDMLTLERKVRFYKAALAKCHRERRQGYSAGAFMLGRFIALTQPVGFWRAFTPIEIALLINEWVLFEKYMMVLHLVGERKIVRAKRKILEEGLDDLPLTEGFVKSLITVKLARVSLAAVLAATPATCDPQTRQVIAMLGRPFGSFYDYQAPWSRAELEKTCAAQGLPVPGPDEV